MAHIASMSPTAAARRHGRRCDRLRAYDRGETETERGIHAHHNLSLGVANRSSRLRKVPCESTPALREWDRRGNAPLESVRGRQRIARAGNHGCDVMALMDAAEDLVRPPRTVRFASNARHWSRLCGRHRASSPCGKGRCRIWPGHARILIEIGARKLVGGQDDMIVDVARPAESREAQPTGG